MRRTGSRSIFEPAASPGIQVVRGELEMDGKRFTAGDGAAIADIGSLTFEGRKDAEILVFDMAA